MVSVLSRSRKSSSHSLHQPQPEQLSASASSPQPTPDSLSTSPSSTSTSYRPPPPSDPSAFDFCNAFWSFSGKHPGTKDGHHDGAEGFDALLRRMKVGTKTLDDLRLLFRERAVMEDEFAKRLQKLSKSPLGAGEVGHLDRAIVQIKEEIDLSGRAHSDLAALLKSQDQQIGQYLTQREGARKGAQAAVEKLFKTKREQRDLTAKARVKYEQDAIQITGMSAHMALSHGRELDKVSMKMDKISQTVVVNEREYKKFVGVLKETTAQWNIQWRAFCDLCQDQEEERLAFIKARLWDWANALSTVAMTEDESSERSRVALEQSNPATDLQLFVRQAGTGQEIPDAPVFVDFKVKAAPAKPTFKVARYPRSSTRSAGVKHSPSAVEDITKVFKAVSPSAQQQERPKSVVAEPKRMSMVAGSVAANSMGSGGGGGNGSAARSAFAPVTTHNQPSQQQYHPQQQHQQQQQQQYQSSTETVKGSGSTANLENALTDLELQSGAHDAYDGINTTASSPTRPVMGHAESASSMHSGQSQQPLQPPQQSSSRHPPSAYDESGRRSPSPSKPGFASASVFKRRSTQPPPPQQEPPSSLGSSSAPARYNPDAQTIPPVSAPAPPPVDDDEDDDPLVKALAQMSAEAPPQQPSRQSRGFGSGGPGVGAVALPGMTSSSPVSGPGRPGNQAGSQRQSAYGGAGSSPSQQTFQQQQQQAPRQPHAQQQQQGSHSTTPFPQISNRSPAPTANLMHAPVVPGGSSRVIDSYGQAFPGERSGSRPPSRQGSNVSQHSNANAAGPLRSPSPQPFAGVGARGRSPSPQPFMRSPSPSFNQAGGHLGNSPQAPGGYASPGWNGTPSTPQHYQQQPQHRQSQPPVQQQQAYQQPQPQHQPSYGSARSVSPQPYQNSPAVSGYGSPAPPQQQPAYGHQVHQAQSSYHHQQQPSSAPFQQPPSLSQHHQYASSSSQYNPRSPSPAPTPNPPVLPGLPPPTGQVDATGTPILFFVNALFDYTANNSEEFSFSKGDVIGVTAMDADGWWQGRPLGVRTGGTCFPSNFTELVRQ